MTYAPVKSVRKAKSVRRGRPCDASLRLRRCEQILCTASKAFARHGFQETDVQVIAESLGISKGTIYRYFPSKEELFLAAVKKGVQCLKERTHRALNTPGDPLHRLGAATTAYLEFFELYPQLVELFLQESVVFRGKRRPVYFEISHEAREPFRKIIQELIKSGRVRKVSVDRVMNVMGDLVYGTMFTNYLTGRTRSHQEQAADLLDIVFHGILTEPEKKRKP
ncbi:MAG TPA: TetR/AcrR family transcriptional regulator [Tepidisphaeraceae bacterium]